MTLKSGAAMSIDAGGADGVLGGVLGVGGETIPNM